jgi:hypothetical protein
MEERQGLGQVPIRSKKEKMKDIYILASDNTRGSREQEMIDCASRLSFIF